MKLWEPGKIGTLTLKNRIIMSAMGGAANQFDPEGTLLTRAGIDYYAARARGGTGLILPGSFPIDWITGYWDLMGKPVKPGEYDREKRVAGLRRLAEAIHEYDAKLCIQLIIGPGRNFLGYTKDYVHPEMIVTPSPESLCHSPHISTRAATLEEIERWVKGYQTSAGMIKEAGADAIEINAHGGYLLDAFATKLWNRRTDKYGGDFNGRFRIWLECIESIKRGAGADFPIIVKYPPVHYVEGARDIDEGLEIARRLEAAGVDAINVDAGTYETLWYFSPPTTMPPGCTVDLSEKVKKVVNIPVIVTGKLGRPQLAERVLQEGKADFISIGKQSIADPEWASKVRDGRMEDIVPCIGDEEGCLKAAIWVGTGFTCAVNPEAGKEKELAIRPADRKKSVLVVGGGPSGLEAAMVAARRGHKVTLWEKGYALGGNIRLSSVPDFKDDYRLWIKYLSTQINKLGVNVEFGKEATPERIQRMKPDGVIVATGGKVEVPNIPGKDRSNVTSSLDVAKMCNGLLKWSTMKQKGWKKIIWFFGNIFAKHLEPEKIEKMSKWWLPFGKSVIVIGGAFYGCEMALFLAQKGRKVTIVESSGPDTVAGELWFGNRLHLLKLLEDNNVDILTDTKTLEITGKGITIQDKSGKKSTLRADTMMISVVRKPDDSLAKSLEGKVPEVYAVGDAVDPQKALEAVRAGFDAACKI